MCNLFQNTTNFRDLVEAFAQHRLPVLKPAPGAAPNLPPLEAVRPTDPAPVVRAYEDGAELITMRWGFDPGRPKSGPVTNFRSEGRQFANGEDRGRCLVPATAFYEFTGDRSPKTRWRFTETGEPWFCLAGLWRRTETDLRFTLLTMEPGPDMSPYHDRQVVLLPRSQWRDWLTGAPEGELLKAGPAGSLSVVNDTPGKQPPPLPLFTAP